MTTTREIVGNKPLDQGVKMATVVPFTGLTILPSEPDRILDAAKDQGLDRVLIVGVMPDGDLWLSGSHSDVAENLFALERAKGVLMARVTAEDLEGA